MGKQSNAMRTKQLAIEAMHRYIRRFEKATLDLLPAVEVAQVVDKVVNLASCGGRDRMRVSAFGSKDDAVPISGGSRLVPGIRSNLGENDIRVEDSGTRPLTLDDACSLGGRI
ncbi:hypothetical protein Trydic_g15251 [Trypoxylus dichotomus]